VAFINLTLVIISNKNHHYSYYIECKGIDNYIKKNTVYSNETIRLLTRTHAHTKKRLISNKEKFELII